MDSVRIRLVFEERHLLNKSQRKNGLKRSWILLKSHLHSISDFTSYLIDFFLLRDACPDGLVLSMDDFALPPFEPTSVLKDKDIVRVKKKKEDNVTAVDKMADVVEECSDFKNEAGEDTLDSGISKKTVCRKRKALKTLHSSKIKKNRSAPTAKCPLAPSNLQQICTEHNRRSEHEKSLVKKHKASNFHTDTNDSNKQNASKVQQLTVEKSKGKLPDENYSEDSEQLDGCSNDEEIVPVVIRPGHVRFLPLGQVEANTFVHPVQASMDTLSLNGITIKKGQKWGKGKSSSWTSSNCKNCEGQSSKPRAKKDLAAVNCPIDFNKLRPCASLPKRGDIIAYRLIELSSSWTPELSSFRVGKVSWCKPEANKIMLIPVPEYPFVFKKAINEESAKQDTSPYAEDGSLKADYSSLVDIRIVEHKKSVGFEAAADNNSVGSGTKQSWNKWENHSSASKQSWHKWENKTSAPKRSWKKWENRANARENGKEKAWDEILQASSTKKTKLSNKVQWRTGEKKAWEAHGP